MPTPGQGSIGSLDYTADERKALARRSVDWGCTECGKVSGLLLPPSQEKNMEQKEEMDKIVQSVAFKSEEEIAKKHLLPAKAQGTLVCPAQFSLKKYGSLKQKATLTSTKLQGSV